MRRFLKSHWQAIAVVSFTLPLMAFIAICLVIGSGVRGAIADAQSHHPGEPISALLAVAADGNLEPAVRNRAIWALGQLGRSEAVPVLKSLAAPGPCDHERSLCRHEIAKAMAACSGGRNIGAVIWRHGELAAAR